MQKKFVWLFCFLVCVVVFHWLITVERETHLTEVISDEDLAIPSIFTEPLPAMDDWSFKESESFFVEYRLQRDRVRGQEIEILKDFIDNPNTSPEGKKKAESQLLLLVDIMEKELLTENLVKAQGHKDAIFFYRDSKAHLVLKSRDISEKQFAQLVEIVSVIAGINMEDVVIIEKP